MPSSERELEKMSHEGRSVDTAVLFKQKTLGKTGRSNTSTSSRQPPMINSEQISKLHN